MSGWLQNAPRLSPIRPGAESRQEALTPNVAYIGLQSKGMPPRTGRPEHASRQRGSSSNGTRLTANEVILGRYGCDLAMLAIWPAAHVLIGKMPSIEQHRAEQGPQPAGPPHPSREDDCRAQDNVDSSHTVDRQISSSTLHVWKGCRGPTLGSGAARSRPAWWLLTLDRRGRATLGEARLILRCAAEGPGRALGSWGCREVL